MIDHNDPNKKPFKIGQLLFYDSIEFLLVLNVKWNFENGDWRVTVLSQKTGKKEKIWAESLEWLRDLRRLRKF